MTGKTVGVLGGMGPDATVDFMASVIALTKAGKDQDHIRMVVDHNPQVPDRQEAMHGDRTKVSAALREMALRLENAGADFLVMPCNTAHAFLPDILASIHIPFLHIVDETVAEVAAVCPPSKMVGILATTACIEAGIYQAALNAAGRTSVLPDQRRQREIMKLIFRIKGGDKGAEVRAAMRDHAMELAKAGAAIVIAGCTEIPLVVSEADLDVPLVSSTDVLARRTVAFATE